MHTLKYRINKFTILITILVIIIIVFFLYTLLLLNSNSIYKGISINNIDISGYNTDKALKILNDRYSKYFNYKKIVLYYEDKYYFIKSKDIELTYDYYKALEKAYSIGRNKNYFKRLLDILICKFKGKNIELDLIFNNDKLNLELNRIANKIDIEPIDASIKYLNNEFIIKNEIIGRKVDKDKLRNIIISTFDKNELIKIPVKVIQPKIKSNMLTKIDYRISSFVTYFNMEDKNRASNLKTVAEKIDGKILLSNEVFSFNSITGKRDKESGYKKGKVIINGKYVPQIAGGVCQVSTTLYNAVLLANLEIIERHPHSLPVRYIKYGRDATVAYDYYDLKFRNNTEYPIYIECKVYNSMIYVNIYSNKTLVKNIYIETKLIDIVNYKVEVLKNKNLKPGDKKIIKEGKNGYIVETYRVIKEKNKLYKELISKDYYKPINAIVEVGY